MLRIAGFERHADGKICRNGGVCIIGLIFSHRPYSGSKIAKKIANGPSREPRVEKIFLGFRFTCIRALPSCGSGMRKIRKGKSFVSSTQGDGWNCNKFFCLDQLSLNYYF